MFNSFKENIERRLGLKTAPTTRNTNSIEAINNFSGRFKNWKGDERLKGYPFIENTNAPFTPMRRSLPMLNLALISSAGAYIDGTTAFDIESRDGDISYKEIPIEVEAEDLLYA